MGVRGHAPPENFEINGAIWCVLGPPESFLDQRKSIYFSIKMEMNSSIKYYGMVYDLGYMIYKVFSVVIIRSGERGWISHHIFLLKKYFFGQNNVDSAAYSRIGSYAPDYKYEKYNYTYENSTTNMIIYNCTYEKYN